VPYIIAGIICLKADDAGIGTTASTLIKKKKKFSSYIRNSNGSGCKVLYEEGAPYI
jgi:hypothetical protein